MWKKVYGHDLAYRKVRFQLQQALSLSSNIYITCHHTNRVLHVKYDKEIIGALQKTSTNENNQPFQESSLNLSPGAKMRIKQVLEVLLNLREHSHVMNDFSTRSISVLKVLT